jgi:hypothetical protein
VGCGGDKGKVYRFMRRIKGKVHNHFKGSQIKRRNVYDMCGGKYEEYKRNRNTDTGRKVTQ